MDWLTVYALVHVAFGVLTYGLYVAYFQREYPHFAAEHLSQDRRRALFVAAFGPCGFFGFVFAALTSKSNPFKHGWKL